MILLFNWVSFWFYVLIFRGVSSWTSSICLDVGKFFTGPKIGKDHLGLDTEGDDCHVSN